MTGDPPRRWPDDSPGEDAEAHRQRELARLETWMREQKTRPLADALGGGSPGGESWAGPLIAPDWWDDVAEPGTCCPWCQRPGVPAPCGECLQARATAGDPPSLWAWWASLTPARRRAEIAARFGTDPWSGRRAPVSAEWTDISSEGEISTGRHRYTGCTPDGIYWAARRVKNPPRKLP